MQRRTTNIDMLVFAVCLAGFGLWVTWTYAYSRGVEDGRKQCAKLAGHDPISTTADVCTFAQSYGRATIKRRAL